MPGTTAGGTLPAPVPSRTRPRVPCARDARMRRSSDPAARTCRSTAVTSLRGRRTGPRKGGAWKRTRPRSSTPSDPVPLRNASSRCVCHLRTRDAAWISSPTTTSAPRPPASGWAAVRTAAVRLAGPSQPGSENVRMAPQSTTGFGLATVRSSRNAVSSSVSVPCVMTTPSTAGSARTRSTSARRRHIHGGVTCGPGRRARSSRRRRASPAQPRHAGHDLPPRESGQSRPGHGVAAHGDRPAGEEDVDGARSLIRASRGREPRAARTTAPPASVHAARHLAEEQPGEERGEDRLAEEEEADGGRGKRAQGLVDEAVAADRRHDGQGERRRARCGRR